MIPHSDRARHNLFWLSESRQIDRFCYHPGQVQGQGSQTIFGLKRKHADLGQFLRFWRSSPDGTSGSFRSDLVQSRVIVQKLQSGALLPRSTARAWLVQLLKFGPYSWILTLTRVPWLGLESLLTNKVARVIKDLRPQKNKYRDLLFLTAKPDLYWWQSDHKRRSSVLVVCFTTRSGSLNVSLPIAHSALSIKGVDLLYVCLKRRDSMETGINGLGDEGSARAVAKLIEEMGYDRVVGLGTSLGGNIALRWASLLGLSRVLNYSGIALAGDPGFNICNHIRPGVQPLVRSILDGSDPLDQKINSAYDRLGLKGDRVYRQFWGHGTFSGSMLSGDIEGDLEWLLN